MQGYLLSQPCWSPWNRAGSCWSLSISIAQHGFVEHHHGIRSPLAGVRPVTVAPTLPPMVPTVWQLRGALNHYETNGKQLLTPRPGTMIEMTLPPSRRGFSSPMATCLESMSRSVWRHPALRPSICRFDSSSARQNLLMSQKNMKKPAEFTMLPVLLLQATTIYKIQDCHAPAEGPESVAFKVVGYGGYGDSSLAIMHSLWTLRKSIPFQEWYEKVFGAAANSIPGCGGKRGMFESWYLEVLLLLALKTVSIQKDLMIHYLLMGFPEVCLWPASPPVCWSDILDAKNWLPPETWMIDSDRCELVCSKTEDGHRKVYAIWRHSSHFCHRQVVFWHCKDTPVKLKLPSVSVRRSTWLTWELCASFLVLNAPEIFERCFVFLV